jgi:hypothetical protein
MFFIHVPLLCFFFLLAREEKPHGLDREIVSDVSGVGRVVLGYVP